MSNRFKASNGRKLVDHLHSTGLDPSASLGEPSRSFCGGCTDPDCCAQHPGFIGTEPAVAVRSRLSNSQLHRLAVKLGLVSK